LSMRDNIRGLTGEERRSINDSIDAPARR
jgi:hypothetical protein